jgi:hypothetical protein
MNNINDAGVLTMMTPKGLRPGNRFLSPAGRVNGTESSDNAIFDYQVEVPYVV